ncbi:hypothetical protein [Oceanobacillus zhaokaii]|uniref:hypothetical protein n=1 Tax=Oceanobacillus zhaokaii TaxID=2052660 RepID=UPI001FA83F88|nr:hypothetical protein [Oceanobacillus zhaokaii]
MMEQPIPYKASKLYYQDIIDTVFRNMGEINPGRHFNNRTAIRRILYEFIDTKVVDSEDRTIITPKEWMC